ncbi:GNAT family N-acetyltransferase [Bradyrhizobium tunisiense]|uniref:GNAT family N-acetyltransferase n=1 Tax=Bradyrhizobium tunisiense TaxID=3278709 RepID=UPI0035DB9628
MGSNNLQFGYAFPKYGAGRGLGPEAARFTIMQALRNSNKEKVVGLIARGNARSERAAKKLGLRYIDDRWHNGRLWQYYEMTREEYFSQSHHRVTG